MGKVRDASPKVVIAVAVACALLGLGWGRSLAVVAVAAVVLALFSAREPWDKTGEDEEGASDE
ncbi:MAG: hypothetical protein JRG92_16520 [Deltaproteobacteria bacterium]|nr:hypothetical protein [Deltaproteobacteria bacterium]MBW2385238.1 hypothetical protein [Deltaproteobacteria bacterium]MBW2695029.1 hypothetical protein [Deltaproteobacteria bacterium]